MYFNLKMLTDEAARTIIVFWTNAIINMLRKMFEETGLQYPTVQVVEEAGRLNAVTPVMRDGMRTWRKAGYSTFIVDQTGENFEDEVREDMMGLSQRRIYHHVDTGIDRAAKDLADFTFDPLAVHYRRTRQVQDGTEEITVVNKGKRYDKSGKVVGKDERSGTSFRNKYREEVDEFYKTAQLQAQEWATRLSRLKTGQCIMRDERGVRTINVTMLGEPWPFGLTALKTARAIEEIRRRPQYQPPRQFRLPTVSTPRLAPTTTPPNPNRGGAAARFGGGTATSS